MDWKPEDVMESQRVLPARTLEATTKAILFCVKAAPVRTSGVARPAARSANDAWQGLDDEDSPMRRVLLRFITNHLLLCMSPGKKSPAIMTPSSRTRRWGVQVISVEKLSRYETHSTANLSALWPC